MRAKLQVASGGVVFTTIQKFMPEEKGDRHPVLSERRNIVVIADEAHRSQYIDGATVPIYYESRLAKLELKPSERPKIDLEFEELTEGEEVERKEKLKTKWAQLEAIVGSESRVKIIARDLVAHFEEHLGRWTARR